MFSDKKEFQRAKNLAKFYQYQNIPIRFSKVIQQPVDVRQKILEKLYKSERCVDILSYCLMPNHFHFLLRQNREEGVSNFMANFTNAYTKYFNTKHERVGPLTQGAFKAVHIENDEQLIHVSRYIHLNPVVSGVIPEEDLANYLWSSFTEYTDISADEIVQKGLVLGLFKNTKDYQSFVIDQIDYGRKLEEIKHLLLE